MKIYLQFGMLLLILLFFNQASAKEVDNQKSFTNNYSVAIPDGYVIFLHQAPAKPGEPAGKRTDVFLKKGDKVKANIATKLSNITDECKRTEGGKKIVYEWKYTQDWVCVQVISPDIFTNKVGWINKTLIEPL